jgi:hypothetical protein
VTEKERGVVGVHSVQGRLAARQAVKLTEVVHGPEEQEQSPPVASEFQTIYDRFQERLGPARQVALSDEANGNPLKQEFKYGYLLLAADRAIEARMYSENGGETIAIERPPPPPNTQVDVPLFGMRDERWKDINIGRLTMEEEGCVLVSMAMAAAWATGNPEMTPARVFYKGIGNSYRTTKLDVRSPGLLDSVRESIRAGSPVMLSMTGDFPSFPEP